MGATNAHDDTREPIDPLAHSAYWHERLQDSVDGALDVKGRAELDLHLHTCDSCRSEHAKLLALHALLAVRSGTAPTLSSDFSARVLTSIDAQEQARLAAAKLRAERDFRKRLDAFELDWRSLWQRHMGSIIAGTTTIAAVGATLGATWSSLRGLLVSSLPSLASVGLSGTTATALTASLAVAAAAVWILSTKAR